jgi:mannan endo-1,4-beta-mannosidase
VRVTNTGTSSRSGWTASWQYAGANRVTNAWNGTLTGTNPYSVNNLGWNGTLGAGQSVEFGFQGNTNGGTIETPVVTCR